MKPGPQKTNTSLTRGFADSLSILMPFAEKPTKSSFDNLIMRFEEPSSMARWDSPLFAISWDDDLEGVSHTTLDDLWLAVTQGVKKGPTAAVVTVRYALLVHLLHLTKLYRRASSHPQMRCKR